MDNAPNSSSAAAAASGNGVQGGAGGDRPEDPSKQNLAQVTGSIQKTLGLLHQLNLNVSSFSSASQLPLLQRLNALVAELDAMQKLADGCNIQVPMEVVNLIDDGKNPDEFTRDVLNSCIAKNQITKGKTDAFKSLRKHLLEELEEAFPDDVEAYRQIRATSAAYHHQEFSKCLMKFTHLIKLDVSVSILRNSRARNGILHLVSLLEVVAPLLQKARAKSLEFSDASTCVDRVF
ncbi:mediator of RNA polymerase II transcription subunit 10b-like isoform X2 [Triticum dicoccoides]|uniref:mediator of RNA polymerase II transcription subunit 10b-like isoform X2 n=1 Tax=Triticum dicoccoides TaxID=85692 RepID=UPI00188E245C|nr:mediator of RNA polymerase II transcription subunit 10b-like isoform X2 [Triticum dicoccoides]